MKKFQKLIGDPKCHVEVRKGTRDEARAYCMKAKSRVKDPFEWGKWNKKGQGNRTDLDTFCKKILEGKKTVDDLAHEMPITYVRHQRGLKELENVYRKNISKKFRKVNVTVITGEPGTGKTKLATKGEDWFILDQSERVWFDGYNYEKTLIIDDFYGWIKWGQLLRILDGHQYRAEIKGGFKYAAWENVIITSNQSHKQWYNRDDIAALERRITSYTHHPIVTGKLIYNIHWNII